MILHSANFDSNQTITIESNHQLVSWLSISNGLHFAQIYKKVQIEIILYGSLNENVKITIEMNKNRMMSLTKNFNRHFMEF